MEIGNLIADAMEKVGKDGVITVEESKTHGDRRSTSSKACSSTAATSPPYFVTNRETMSAVLDEPYILIHDKKISA